MSEEPMKADSVRIPTAAEDEEVSEVDEEGNVSNEKIHNFYFVKFWPYNDPQANSKFEWAKKLSEELDKEKAIIDIKFKEIMSRREEVNSELERLRYRSAVLECGFEWKTMVVDFLQAALQNLNDNVAHGSEEQLWQETANKQHDIKSSFLHSEINRAYFWYSMSSNRKKFEQLLEEIKQIEEREEKAMAEEAAYPQTSKKAIEEQINLLNKIPEELRPEHCQVMDEIMCLEAELKVLEEDESVLMEQFNGLFQRKYEAYESIRNIHSQREESISNYHEYLSLLSKARELAGKKDVAALEELSNKQVDNFMSRWNSSQPFKLTYEKSILQSLDNRGLSRDGRLRIDGEETILLKDSTHGNDDNIEAFKSLILHYVASSLALLMILDVRNKM